MISRHSLPLSAFALLGATSGLHATNTYNVVWDGTLGTSWTADDGEFRSRMTLGQAIPNSGQVGMALPPLTVDFGASKAFQMTLSAPTGRSIIITPPTAPENASANPAILSLRVASNDSSDGPTFSGTFTGFSFTGLQGVQPVEGYSFFSYNTGANSGITPMFVAYIEFELSGPISFTSLNLNFMAPDELAIAGTFGEEQSSRIRTSWSGDYSGGLAPNEPANWVQLSPIPEPSTYGLILGGLALVGAAIRRRAKRG
ncbi:MAG: PEP-CTERM sorting domain-containing protein [Opitutia bacterium]